MSARVVIDEGCLRQLVQGRTLTLGGGLEITLAPTIGWSGLLYMIADALGGDGGRGPHRPPDPPEAREFLPSSKKARR
jgi:hypothetical protein